MRQINILNGIIPLSQSACSSDGQREQHRSHSDYLLDYLAVKLGFWMKYLPTKWWLLASLDGFDDPNSFGLLTCALSHASSRLWGRSCRSVMWSRPRYLNNYWRDCNAFYSLSLFPEDESYYSSSEVSPSGRAALTLWQIFMRKRLNPNNFSDPGIFHPAPTYLLCAISIDLQER